MLDTDRSGKLGFEEFKVLWDNVRNWKVSTYVITILLFYVSLLEDGIRFV